MQKANINSNEIKIIGLKIRTSTKAEFNPLTARIAATIQKFFQAGISTKIKHRANNGKIFAVYFDYESDYTGEYSYIIGEEVTEFEEVAEGLDMLTIPAQAYSKFTTDPGVMPLVVINAWQEIWQMKELEKERNYKADFEVYDQRAANPAQAIIDIYIGIKG